MRQKSHTMTQRTSQHISSILNGERKFGFRSIFVFMGPAVIASIAYMDPGNFATNIEAGSSYGYKLLWVVFFANIIAMFFQALSAKLGIVTGLNLAEVCRDQLSKTSNFILWIISEIAAMATDLAEFIGGAIGLSLLFHLPLLVGMAITAIITYGLLVIDRYGFRPIELLITLFVASIGLCYLVEMFIAPVDWLKVGYHMLVPELPDNAALAIAVGIIGATIMPHAIYLHSGLTAERFKAKNDTQKRKLLRFSNIEVVIALALAGMVNMAMLIMASAAFHPSHSGMQDIGEAYHTLIPLLGGAAGFFFLMSLLVSGISSSMVGTMAGQLIMQGFVGWHIPIFVRRLVTMVPAFFVVGWGVNSTTALIVSQVVLSFALPIPMLTLLYFTSNKKIMGSFVNKKYIIILATICTVVILFLNILLLLTSFNISIPYLS